MDDPDLEGAIVNVTAEQVVVEYTRADGNAWRVTYAIVGPWEPWGG